MKCGIYTITNKVNNKIYIGFTKNLNNRYFSHTYLLKRNKHKNIYLQASWNKYGEENFIYEILEECNLEYLPSQENYWCNLLNTHDRNYGYNFKYTHPENRKIMSKEELINLSIRNKIKIQCENCLKFFNKLNYRKYHGEKCGLGMSQKDKEKLSKSVNTNKNIIIIQKDLNGTLIKEFKSIKEAARKTKTGFKTIKNFCENHNRKIRKNTKYTWEYKYKNKQQ